MLEPTKGNLTAIGTIFGLNDKFNTYQNEYFKTLKFGIRTSDLNSLMVSCKYWNIGDSLNVSIRSENLNSIKKYTKEELHEVISSSFKNGDNVYVRCLLDINSNAYHIVEPQLIAMFYNRKSKKESSDIIFEQEIIFDEILDTGDSIVVNSKIVDYKGFISDFKKLEINYDNKELIEQFKTFKFGDFVIVSGEIYNSPIFKDNTICGKSFNMYILNVISKDSNKYTKEQIDNASILVEEIITESDKMPWEE